jgi:LPS export ABC transporter protein LptC
MMRAVRNGLIFVLLAGAAIFTWLSSRPVPPVDQSTQGQPIVPRGYYLRDAVILGTDSSGLVSYRVFAGTVEQPAQERNLVLREVRVEYDAREDVPWMVTAARATTPGKGEVMQLYEVRLSTLPAPGTDPTVIEAPELAFDPEAYLAWSTEPVVVSRGSARLDAMRLSVDLREDQIELESGNARFNR